MQSTVLLPILSVLLGFTDARVTFPFSEVLQVNDLKNWEWEGDTKVYKTPFACDDGCKVYTDLDSDQYAIALNDEVIANFTDFVGDTSTALDGYELAGNDSYTIRAYANNEDFVFYAVSAKAPNYAAPVYSPQGAITADAETRFITVLSSYEATQFSQFDGVFPAGGYPKIYAAGYDNLDDLYGETKCRPVYQGRSQSSAANSSPTIFSPVITIDFGYTGNHSVGISPSDGKNLPKLPNSSTVYMSPGYVGCPFESDQAYLQRITSVSDSFMLVTDSLDINAVYYSLTANELVNLRVDEDILSFYNYDTNSLSTHYGAGAYKVTISWNRRTPYSGFFLQMDFGNQVEAVPTTTTTPPPPTSPTSPTTPPTTTSASALSLLISTVIVFFASTL